MANQYVLTIKANVSGNPDQPSDAGEKTTKKATDGADSLKKIGQKVAGFYASTALVRQAVNTSVGLMDVFTGNDYQQRVIQGAISIAEEAVGLGITFAISRVAFAATLAAKAISLGGEATKKSVDLYTQSLEAGLVRQRAGGTFNRSRIAGRY